MKKLKFLVCGSFFQLNGRKTNVDRSFENGAEETKGCLTGNNKKIISVLTEQKLLPVKKRYLQRTKFIKENYPAIARLTN